MRWMKWREFGAESQDVECSTGTHNSRFIRVSGVDLTSEMECVIIMPVLHLAIMSDAAGRSKSVYSTSGTIHLILKLPLPYRINPTFLHSTSLLLKVSQPHLP